MYQRDLKKAIRVSASLYDRGWEPIFEHEDQKDYRSDSTFTDAVLEGYDISLKKLATGVPKGQACMPLSLGIYWHLNLLGYSVEVVLGDVAFKESGKFFGASSKGLCKEFQNRSNYGIQKVHAWVQVGQDTIIDFGLPGACKQNKSLGESGRNIAKEEGVLSTADTLESIGVRYMPMFIGEEFVAETNTNPLCDFSRKKRIVNDRVRSSEGLDFLLKEFNDTLGKE
jgi:hypothetical protein